MQQQNLFFAHNKICAQYFVFSNASCDVDNSVFFNSSQPLVIDCAMDVIESSTPLAELFKFKFDDDNDDVVKCGWWYEDIKLSLAEAFKFKFVSLAELFKFKFDDENDDAVKCGWWYEDITLSLAELFKFKFEAVKMGKLGNSDW